MSSTDHSKNDAAQIASELNECTAKANQSSHTLCQYVLENVLLHQAAAQQLQVRSPLKLDHMPQCMLTVEC